ncbi:SAM-dependent methyltransferase [Rugosimonospora acidiphila]|uniref:SAM-dependent methyltransferase n=1 Tax=Rugosimonospora acidiphila TaxID=556531 RepID=A0ABP9SKU3_9ACTN
MPEGLDVNVPNAARMYDYALGGYHNFAIDREFVERAEAAMPGARLLGHANRAFLGRAVQWLARAGIRQFLDIGSGIPTLGNVHEVAQDAAPEARVVYVDIDPVAVEHGRAILAANPRAVSIEGDLRRPGEILYHPDVVEMLDFSQPVAVLMIAVLHFVSDDDNPAGIVSEIRDALVSGSYLAMSHGTPVEADVQTISTMYKQTTTPLHLRTVDAVGSLMTGLDLVEPGIVPVSEWHPDPADTVVAHPGVLAAVGRKP